MGDRNKAAAAEKNNETAGRFILWIAASVLIMVILVPLFSRVWRERTQVHTVSECELIADARLKQEMLEHRDDGEIIDMLRQYVYALNSMALWAYTHGEADEGLLQKIFDDSRFMPQSVAFLRGDKYESFPDGFTREEFDQVQQKADEIRSGRGEGAPAQSESGETENNGGSDGVEEYTAGEAEWTPYSCIVQGEDDIWYIHTQLPKKDAVMISRLRGGEIPLNDTQEALYTFTEFSLPDSDYSMVLTSGPNHRVLYVQGNVGLKKGDLLEEKIGTDHILQIGGGRYIVGEASSDSISVLILVPEAEVSSMSVISPVFPALLFMNLFLLTVLYAWFLRIDILRGRVEQAKEGETGGLLAMMVRRVRLTFILTMLIVLILFLVVCSLCVVDRSRVWGARILADIEDYFDHDASNASVEESLERKYETSVADKISMLVDEDPDRMENEALADLSEMIRRDIFILNGSGTVTGSSKAEYDFSDISDEDSDWSVFSNVLRGKANHLGTGAYLNGSWNICWAVRRSDLGGMLLLLNNINDPISLSQYYADYKVPEGLVLFAVDNETGEIISSSKVDYCSRSAASIGITKKIRENGYVGDAMVDGRRYFVQTNADELRSDIIAADLLFLARLYVPVVLITIACGLVVVLLMLAAVWFVQSEFWTKIKPEPDEARHRPGTMAAASNKEAGETEEQKREREKQEEETEENASFYREEDGGLHADRGAAGRWKDLATPFRMKSADEKFHTVSGFLFAILLISCLILYQHSSIDGIMGSPLVYLLQRSWRYGINIYAISYTLLFIDVVLVIAMIVRKIAFLIGGYLGNRGETIARLLGSFVNYASAIIIIVYGLMYIGVNTMTILASVGIVGLGISIGAKDLVSDILAGIAIVFEGEFRTGDIVEINGFRGQVEEIGVRTTKVMSMENVKIFRNSEVSGVINMTQRHSIAMVEIQVSRAEPIEKVEKTFEKAFPGILRRIPQAFGGITSGGIKEMNANYVVLMFLTKCRESDRITVERMLRRELDLVMEKENIGSWGMWKTEN